MNIERTGEKISPDKAKQILQTAFSSAESRHLARPDEFDAAAREPLTRLREQLLANPGDINQNSLAQSFFEETIGRDIANNRSAYTIYSSLIGTPFAQRFKTLEDERLKRAGFEGFSL